MPVSSWVICLNRILSSGVRVSVILNSLSCDALIGEKFLKISHFKSDREVLQIIIRIFANLDIFDVGIVAVEFGF